MELALGGLGDIALVVDPGGLALAEVAQITGEVRKEGVEDGGVVLVAGVGVMEQGELVATGDGEGQSDLAEVVAVSLGVATLGHRRPRVVGGDEGEEVGGVEGDHVVLDVEPQEGLASDLPEDGLAGEGAGGGTPGRWSGGAEGGAGPWGAGSAAGRGGWGGWGGGV